MSNRTLRRRVARRSPDTSTHKQTHKLPPQICVVWVPEIRGYAANLGPEILQVVSEPSLAYLLTETEAEELAIELRERLGLRAAIRPFYPLSAG